jgi:hypothetical protein
MGFLGSLFKKPEEPRGPNPMRDTLFGDMPLKQFPPTDPVSSDFPWSEFILARSQLADGHQDKAIECWRKIVGTPGLEPRLYLQAWHFLRHAGQSPPTESAKLVLGVVVEVAMPKGLDLLAAYADHSARYYNFSGAGVIWEHPDGSLDSEIDQLLQASKSVVDKIGPWDQPRPAPPPRDHARLCFLTPSGLHFGQAPMSVLSRDPPAGRVLMLATVLMKSLIAKTKKT